MNRRSRFAYLSAAAIAALLCSGNNNNVQARNLNWDADAETGALGTDGSGSWDLVTSNWVDGGLISGTNVTWLNSPSDSATFGTTTTALVSGAANNIDFSTAITVQDLTLAQDAAGNIYNFSDFGGGPLTIQGNVNKTALTGFINWLVPNNGVALDTGSHTFAIHDSPGDTAPELTINGAITGPGNIVMDNGAYDSYGTMAINVDSTYDGTTTINKGRLIITKPNALGSSAATSGTIINNQGTLSIGGGGTTGLVSMTVAEPITINRDTYTGTDFTQYPYAVIKQNGAGDVTFSGAVTLGSTDARISVNTGTLTITNDLQASIAAPVLTLTGDFAGFVRLQGNNVAALSAGGIKLLNSVELQAYSQNEIGGPSSPITFAGDATLGIMNGFMTDFGTHAVNYSSFSGGLDIPTGFTFNLTQPITGGSGVGKRGGGTLNFNASVNGNGFIFWDAGTVNINAPVTLGSLHLRSPVVNINNGGSITTTGGYNSFGADSTGTNGGPDMAVVNITGNGQLIQTSGDDFNISDNANTTGTINMSGSAVLTTGGITFLGKSTNAVGTINQTGGTVNINRNGNFGLVLGDGRFSQGPTGYYGMSGTSVLNCAGEMYVGEGNNSGTHGMGHFTMSGGTVNLSNWFVVGREGGIGTVDISGNSIFNHTGGFTSIGDSAGGVNTMTLRGNAQYLSTAGEFWVGTGGGSVAVLNVQDNAVLAVTDWFPVGRAGAFGTLDISGNATVTKTGGNNSYVGESTTSVTSTMTVRGNGKFTASSGEFWVGQGGGSGILTVQDNAGFTVNNWFAIGRQGGSKGIVNFSGGTMTKTLGSGGFLAIGSGGASGTFNQTGGTLSIDGTRVGEASSGTMNLSGGVANFTGEFSLGYNGGLIGTLNISNTANVTVPAVVFGVNAANAAFGGVLNLNGGTLTGASFRGGASTTALRNFNFNGGTLKPSADDTNFMGAKVTGVVSTGGALIDSNNHTVTINSSMIHDPALGGADGGLTKSGLGTVTLAGAVLSYTGPTSVTAGKLSLANNLTTSSSVTVSNNGLIEIVPNGSSTRIVKTGAVTVTGTGKINIQDNKLISTAVGATGSWTGSNYTGITGLIASGRGTGNLWDGTTGIITTQTQAVGSNYTSIGVAKASDVRPATATATDVWGGQTITGTDTLVMYTYGGDATLDGKINIDDYVKIDSGIAAGLTGWVNGDFNYDGKVSIDDYITVIDPNVGNQNGIFPTAGGIDTGGSGGLSGVSAVPEPTSASLLALGAVSLLGRRRRRNHAAGN